jgi:hypothetical protein
MIDAVGVGLKFVSQLGLRSIFDWRVQKQWNKKMPRRSAIGASSCS